MANDIDGFQRKIECLYKDRFGQHCVKLLSIFV
jgi:hypothetical protein